MPGERQGSWSRTQKPLRLDLRGITGYETSKDKAHDSAVALSARSVSHAVSHSDAFPLSARLAGATTRSGPARRSVDFAPRTDCRDIAGRHLFVRAFREIGDQARRKLPLVNGRVHVKQRENFPAARADPATRSSIAVWAEDTGAPAHFSVHSPFRQGAHSSGLVESTSHRDPLQSSATSWRSPRQGSLSPGLWRELQAHPSDSPVQRARYMDSMRLEETSNQSRYDGIVVSSASPNDVSSLVAGASQDRRSTPSRAPPPGSKGGGGGRGEKATERRQRGLEKEKRKVGTASLSITREETTPLAQRIMYAGAEVLYAGDATEQENTARTARTAGAEPAVGPSPPHKVEASDAVLKALGTAPKDRQYEELRLIVELLDAVAAEPGAPLFSAMSEFEKLRCAGVCSLLTLDNGHAVVRRGQPPGAVFLCLRGAVTSVDLSVPLRSFEDKRRLALKELRARAAAQDREPDMDKFSEEWEAKQERQLDQPARLLDQLEDGELPEGSRAWVLGPGAVFGQAVLPDESDGAEDGVEETLGEEERATMIVASAGIGRQSHLLVLSRENLTQLAGVVRQDFQHKVQFLRSVKMMAGVSRLGLKMLAMLLNTVSLKPNTVVVAQGQVPPLMFLISKGVLRIVRRIAKEAGKQQQAPQSKRSLHLSVQATSVEAVGEEDARTLAQLDGKFVETGMLGTTQSFGAIAVLEGKGGWTAAMAASLIATLQVEAFTLSRLDLGKISLEDREAMLENARVVERNIVPPDAETARHFREASAWAAVKGGLIRRSIINRQCWRESVCGHFSHGVSSGSVKQKLPARKLALEDSATPKEHPFHTLGSVVLGLY